MSNAYCEKHEWSAGMGRSCPDCLELEAARGLISLTPSSHGDFSFNVPAERFDRFIDAATDNREKLANFLQGLSEKVRHCEYPFQTTRKEEHGPVDWT